MRSQATSEAIDLAGCSIESAMSSTGIALRELAFVESLGDELSMSLPTLGLEACASSDGRVVSVHMHREGHEGFCGFPLDFEGITFATAESEVCARLGPPAVRGEGKSGSWMRYVFADRYLHFMYSRDSGLLEMVTCGLQEV